MDVYPVQVDDDRSKLIQAGKRYAIEFLVERWTHGEKEPLNNLLCGFKKLQHLKGTNTNSFEYIGGIHGRPFLTRPQGVDPRTYWGGWCHHANVLFPVWHRAYVLYLEKALQALMGEKPVMMAYWDEIGPDTMEKGVPQIFTADLVWIDGKAEANPLKFFTFDMRDLTDSPIINTSTNYEDISYTTVRFPYFHSYFIDGAKVAEDDEKQIATEQINSRYSPDKGLEILNNNVTDWIGGNEKDREVAYNVREEYLISLNSETYTIFSNTQSASDAQKKTTKHVFSLERPHNNVHLAVGAMTPHYKEDHVQAFGDMGYNELAGFDPIFYFHHAFVDLVFWKWQQLHSAEDKLTVDAGGPGTKTSGPEETHGQGPTPNLDFGQDLDMTTELYPFHDSTGQKYLDGNSVTNINKLGYDYVERTKLDAMDQKEPKPILELSRPEERRDLVRVYNVDRTLIVGPFTVAVYLTTKDGQFFVGNDSVFNRLASVVCENCMSNRYLEFYFPLRLVDPKVVYDPHVKIEVDIRGHVRLGTNLDVKKEFKSVLPAQ